jgi:hypothetical protein
MSRPRAGTGADVAGVPWGQRLAAYSPFRGAAARGTNTRRRNRAAAESTAANLRNAAAVAGTHALDAATRAARVALPTATGVAQATAAAAAPFVGRDRAATMGRAAGTGLADLYTAGTGVVDATRWRAAALAYVGQSPRRIPTSFRAKQRSSPVTLTNDLASACHQMHTQMHAPQTALAAEEVHAAAAEGAAAANTARRVATAAPTAPLRQNTVRRGRGIVQVVRNTLGRFARHPPGAVRLSRRTRR